MALEKFHHTITTGYNDDGDPETFEMVLPKFENLPFGLIRKHRSLPAAEQFFAILEDMLSDKQLEKLDKATQKEVSVMFEKWQKDSNINVGES